MKHALVTGATGYIGSYLVKKLIDSGWQVDVIKRRTSNMEKLNHVANIIRTFNYDGTIDSLIDALGNKPDVVFHLATHFIGRHETKDVTGLFESNILFGANLLEAMYHAGSSAIISASTQWQMSHIAQHRHEPLGNSANRAA